MNDEQILMRGGTQKDIDNYARQNGADLTLVDLIIDRVEKEFNNKFIIEEFRSVDEWYFVKNFLSQKIREAVDEYKRYILKQMRGLEIDNRGAENIVGDEMEIPKELVDDMQKFEIGYTTCLNEVKKTILK